MGPRGFKGRWSQANTPGPQAPRPRGSARRPETLARTAGRRGRPGPREWVPAAERGEGLIFPPSTPPARRLPCAQHRAPPAAAGPAAAPRPPAPPSPGWWSRKPPARMLKRPNCPFPYFVKTKPAQVPVTPHCREVDTSDTEDSICVDASRQGQSLESTRVWKTGAPLRAPTLRWAPHAVSTCNHQAVRGGQEAQER